MQNTIVAELLKSFTPDASSKLSPTIQKALFLARRLQERASQLQTSEEKEQQAELDRMLQTPSDKATLAQMTDQAFRTNNPTRAVEHLIHILDVQGVPRFFSAWDKTLLKGFQSFGGIAPSIALPMVKDYMQKETSNVILPGEKDLLTGHLRTRTQEGVRMNVNFLGEAILSEPESEVRLQQYLQGLQWPEIEVASIKISTVYSQISALAREHTVAVLCDRLERLFRSADRANFTRPDGKVVTKFIYLDMEEYRDKELTAEAFMRTLDLPGLTHVRAGIALQSYIPDSFATLKQIQEWARKRAAAGGGRITVRLVKGANMEMERSEASIRGWPQAPFKSKVETDANYKRMLHETMKPENLAAMDVGVASHNLFDMAYALVVSTESNAMDRVQFEMLEGMANHQRRALFEMSRNLLLYAPACKKENFINAIGYLIRRLDENTGPENFLRHAFKIHVDSPEWKKLEQGFLASFDMIPKLPTLPRRTQDRNQPPTAQTHAIDNGWQHFENEADTDFSLPQNGRWAQAIIELWQEKQGAKAPEIPLVVGGQEVLEGRTVTSCIDTSNPGVVVGRYRPANASDIAIAVDCAASDPDGWRSLPGQERFDILGKVAQEVRKARGTLMGAALANGGKTLSESDPEVSEAIDFLEFYRDSARWWQQMPGLKARGKGVVVVVSPWNFPIAIPCGGIASALAAGNTVILKPASDTVLVGWELCQCFWRAGVSKKTLQFVPCSGGTEGKTLVSHPKVNAVILTGGTATAQAMLKNKPGLTLFAETGGKDATIVTAVSDRDQAIKHILHSAFSHAGQKCSATSLLLLQSEVYDDPGFRHELVEAVRSISVGSAWKLETKMGPLIRPPSGDLETALKVLEPGEEWALMPQPVLGNPNLWTGGIKYGVRPGSFTHMTEFFGPILAVMRFDTLEEAVKLVNQTGYGLTSGLESLDEREWDYWKNNILSGNLYINRVTTGAVVLRQPFGGMGKSVFGLGLKAGGPNYVAQLMEFTDVPISNPQSKPTSQDMAALAGELGGLDAKDGTKLQAALVSYEAAVKEEFSLEHDHFKLIGQDNFRRYLPLPAVRIRIQAEDSAFESLARAAAAQVIGCEFTVSTPPGLNSPAIAVLRKVAASWGASVKVVEETDEQLIAAMQSGAVKRVRYASAQRVPQSVFKAAAEFGVTVASVPVSTQGRLELLWYLGEQSISIDYHRYGNLGMRVDEERAGVL